jgi:hypothetical protein
MRDFRLTTCPCGEIHVQARLGERCASCRYDERRKLMAREKAIEKERVRR